MKKLDDIYFDIVKAEHNDWLYPDKFENANVYLKHFQIFSDILTEELEKQIQKQDIDIGFKIVVQNRLQNIFNNHKYVNFTYISALLNAIELELFSSWITPWNILKNTARVIKPTPPPFLQWDLAPPIGTGIPVPEATLFEQQALLIENTFSQLDTAAMQFLHRSIKILIADLYNKHTKTGPPPNYEGL